MRHLPVVPGKNAPISLFEDPASFVGDMMRSFFAPEFSRSPMWSPNVDVVETPKSYVLTVDVPGFDPDAIEVSLVKDTLTLKGERKAENRTEDEKVRMLERSYGSFLRTFTFPTPVSEESVDASTKNGVLTVQVAKSKETQPKRVKVRNA